LRYKGGTVPLGKVAAGARQPARSCSYVVRLITDTTSRRAPSEQRGHGALAVQQQPLQQQPQQQQQPQPLAAPQQEQKPPREPRPVRTERRGLPSRRPARLPAGRSCCASVTSALRLLTL
jgi:hypothetical protein